jgi:hypothetical protein
MKCGMAPAKKFALCRSHSDSDWRPKSNRYHPGFRLDVCSLGQQSSDIAHSSAWTVLWAMSAVCEGVLWLLLLFLIGKMRVHWSHFPGVFLVSHATEAAFLQSVACLTQLKPSSWSLSHVSRNWSRVPAVFRMSHATEAAFLQSFACLTQLKLKPSSCSLSHVSRNWSRVPAVFRMSHATEAAFSCSLSHVLRNWSRVPAVFRMSHATEATFLQSFACLKLLKPRSCSLSRVSRYRIHVPALILMSHATEGWS